MTYMENIYKSSHIPLTISQWQCLILTTTTKNTRSIQTPIPTINVTKLEKSRLIFINYDSFF